ncbi:hypothetical protein PAXINDRAFT_157362 [Paxillus involutus ATCC 200175]|uniref:Uncharacterized protein n=1 Tax=Paxillus involutus ATCC 200175 TaxID=664439 RepID=A0A0C9TTU0_PAXIN|nr:hypothetical protein PAXINDRAFT_157362 [Paxillus involutus ATCC 200175]
MFRGKYNKVKSFIKHYKCLLVQHNVTSKKDKCESITQYCSDRVAQFVEVLGDFVKKRKKEPIEDLSEWAAFQRKYVRIADWLLSRSKITNNDYTKYMWQVIYPSFRRRLEARLIAADPMKDMSIPFKVARIRRAAEGLLQRDWFDLDCMQSDSEKEDSEEEDTSSESSLSDSTESASSDDKESHRKSKYKKKKGKAVDTKKTKTKSKSKREPLEEDTPSKESKKLVKKQQVPDNTVEELVKKMSTISLSDPQYALLYLQALNQEPNIKLMLARPVQNKIITFHPVDHHYLPTPTDSNYPTQRNDWGKVVLRSGEPLWRQEGENMLRAYHRAIYAAVEVRDRRDARENVEEDVLHSDIDDDEVKGWAYPAYHVVQTTREGRREVFDGVYPLRRPREEQRSEETHAEKLNDNDRERDDRRDHSPQKRANKVTKPDKGDKGFTYLCEKKVGRKEAQPKPYDIRQPEYNRHDDDAIMEDVDEGRKGTRPEIKGRDIDGGKKEKKEKEDKYIKKTRDSKREAPRSRDQMTGFRKSELAGEVNPKAVITKILSTPIKLTTGELLGTSKELSYLLAEKLPYVTGKYYEGEWHL